MAEEKKKNKLLPFKELPVYCKILRIVFLVLTLYGVTMTVIGTALGIAGIGILIAGLVSGLLPALAIILIDFSLEKKYVARRDGQVSPKEPKAIEEQPKAEEAPKAEPVIVEKPKEAAVEEKPAPVVKEEPVEVKEEPKEEAPAPKKKKSKKGLIIGLSIAGGILLLLGAAGGTVGYLYSQGVFNRSNGGSSSEDVLPSDYVFNPNPTLIYEEDDSQFKSGSYSSYEFRKGGTFEKYSFINSKLSMIKYGSWVYNKSMQRVSLTITAYDTKYSEGSWSGKYNYDERQYDYCRIVSETKMMVLAHYTSEEIPFALKKSHTNPPVQS